MRRALLLAMCAVSALVVFANTLFAGPNVIHDRWVDAETHVRNKLCSFPVLVSGFSNIDDLIFLDDDGNPVRLLETVNHAEITFSANGKSLTAKGSGGIEYDFNPDGTITVKTFGINLLLTIPGYG